MADYSKLKVAELKDELKARGIPTSGLKLKQNFVDKLIEADALGQTNTSGAILAAPGASDNAGANRQDSTTVAQEVQSRDEKVQDAHVTSTQPVTHESIAENENDLIVPSARHSETNIVIGDAQAQPQSAAGKAPEESAQEPNLGDGTLPTPASGKSAPATLKSDHQPEPASIPAVDGPASQSAARETLGTPPPSSIPTISSTTSNSPVPVKEQIEDSKKRKRRSVTPPPSAADIAQKRAKANDGSPRTTKSVDPTTDDDGDVAHHDAGESVSFKTQPELSALEQMQKVTDAAETIREGNGLPEGEQSEMVGATSIIPDREERTGGLISEPHSKPVQSPEKQSVRTGPGLPLFAGLKMKDPDLPADAPPSKSLGHDAVDPARSTPQYPDPEERAVPPALHPATSSLYIRNFKRPLHIPTLRAHIAKIARGPTSSSTSDEDPIVAYFLDSIRTHALISFTSISAASRVRSALHDTRYPDEKTRDPLWVDFIPDDKIQSWIDIETRSGGRGAAERGAAERGAAERWEVAYEESSGGIEAVLQEVGAGAGAGPQRPSPISQRNASMPGTQRQPSMSDVPRTSAIAGVHPDRLPLVPPERTNAGNASREDQRRASQPETSGTGFRALDELFSFTTAKPKLYYKPVSPQVANRRLDAIKDLRVGHANMGKSGDEDMKRYSFEMYRGEEEWVDKGPEFGFGRRGVERMRGGAPLRGGYRGGSSRGGFRDRDRDDTWRGPRR